jgi:hypothetical protein
MALEPGDTVGSSRLDRTIHRDTSRTEFLATAADTGDRFAVTTLVVAPEERTVLRDHLAEVASLVPEHPNLAGVHEWGEVDDGVLRGRPR